jgi:lauroyl/myristoyl acyltransferase
MTFVSELPRSDRGRMTRFDSSDPERPIHLPPLTAARAALRTTIERHAPIPALIRFRLGWMQTFGGGPANPEMYINCQRNLLRARPCRLKPERAARLSYAVWHLAMRTYAPVFRRSRRWLIDLLEPRGLEHLEAVREAGTGCVIVSAHLGLFSWAGPVLWGMGYPVVLSGRRRTTEDVLYLSQRDGLAGRRLPHGLPGQGTVQLKRLHRLLTEGGWLRHTGDVADPERGLQGRLFGRTVRLVRAPWVLSQTTGAPVVPVILPVGNDLKPRLHVGPPIVVERAPDGRAACEGALQRYLDFLADAVGDAVWNFHPRVWAPWFTDGRA